MWTLIAVLVLLLIQVAMYGVLNDLLREYQENKEISFQSIQVLKNRIDAVCIVAESNADKCDKLAKKSEIAEIQILNLNNKTAQHNTAIHRLQDSCIEVKP